MTEQPKDLPKGLLALRVSVFLVMAMWTLDKFARPEHAGKVYEAFYFLPGLGKGVLLVVGIAEAALLVGFLAGYRKRLTYGLVLLLHAVSTLSSFRQYLAPFDKGNLLFFAAWPMLAACWALYLLRDHDVLWTVERAKTEG